jgi:hypothetical protein
MREYLNIFCEYLSEEVAKKQVKIMWNWSGIIVDTDGRTDRQTEEQCDDCNINKQFKFPAAIYSIWKCLAKRSPSLELVRNACTILQI